MGFDSISKIRFLSANVNGLGQAKKRAGFFSHIKTYKPDVLCLSDTRFDSTLENKLRNEVGFIPFFNSLATGRRGVAILIRKNFPIIIDQCIDDSLGNFLILKCRYDSRPFVIANIYGPNSDQPQFFQELFEKITDLGLSEVIITGDYNVTLNHEIDNQNYASPRNINARKKLNDLMTSNSFIDIYRHLNNDKKLFTWINRGGNQKARLDYYIVSSSMKSYVESLSILPSYRSDHAIISMEVNFDRFKRGRGLWRHNDMYLRDIDYLARTRKTIYNTLAKYLISANHNNFYEEASDQELLEFENLSSYEKNRLEYNINPNLLLEMVLNDIRNHAMAYTVARRRELQSDINNALVNLTWLKQLQGSDKPPQNIDNRIRACENEYETLLDNSTSQTYHDARVRNAIDGEKPTPYFLNSQKNQNAMRYISKLTKISNQGKEIIIRNQTEIEFEIKDFYKNLYSKRNNTINSIDDFFQEDIINADKLTNEERTYLNKELTMQEIYEALKQSNNNSAPGSTGYTYGFYKMFWGDLKFIIMNSYQYSLQHKKLPASLSKGVISLIPKGNKPKDKLDNWRPITLLNSLYKILSKAIANRINKVLPSVVHPDQCGFVKGRYIGECVRTTMDVFDYAKQKQKTGLLLLIDFKKAFDSVSFSFIKKSLHYLGFGETIINWIETLLHNFNGCINHAGNISDYFGIDRGCRQGDPCASLLFVCAIEILCIKLRSSNLVKGFKIDNIEILLSLYADDCSIFLEYDEVNLRNAITILTNFFYLSGLEIHLKKTQCVIFGAQTMNTPKLCHDLGLNWDQEFKLLGVTFNADTLDYSQNFENKIEEIKKITLDWRHRFLTPIGRLCIAKTLLLSKINHLAFVIPSLSSTMVKKLENLIYNFIWGGVRQSSTD